MFIFKYIDADISTISIIIFFILLVIIQFLLCCKAKKLFLRLMPLIVFTVLTLVFFALNPFNKGGLYGADLFFYAISSFTALIACAFGWSIWKIFEKGNK